MMTMTRGLLQPEEILQPEKHTEAITVDNTKPGIQSEIQIDTFAAQGVPLCRDGKVGICFFRKVGGGEHVWIPWHYSRNGRH